MRIQFWGDVAGTGFGTVTADLGQALIGLGHDVRFCSHNAFEDDLPQPYRKWDEEGRIFRVTTDLVDRELAFKIGDDESAAALTVEAVLKLIRGELWADDWRPEAAIILGDYMNVRRFVMADEHTAHAFSSLPTFHYVPVEGVDLPPIWKIMWEVIHPVAMSEFGAEQIRLVTGEKPPVVYHGVDTNQFRPVSPERPLYMGERKLRTKAECKRFFGGDPVSRWIFRADRNMPRKHYARLFRALAPVLARRPDTYLVVHCQTTDEGGHLYDLKSKYHPEIAKRIIFTGFHDQGIRADRNILTALYNAADVYASPSAEGFGLTIAEAMACGTPAVGMDYSSVTEVIGNGGLLAPVNHLVDNEYDHAWAAVDERVFGAQVAKLLDDPTLRAGIGRQARKHVVDTFNWDREAFKFSAIIRERVQTAVAA